MAGQPLQQRIFPEQSYQGTASHTVSTGEPKQKTVFNCKQGNTGYIYNIKRNTGIQLRQKIMEGYGHSGFVLFRVLQIPSLSMTFSMTLGLAVTFETFQNCTCFSVFFDLKQFNRNELWYPPKCVPFEPFNYLLLFILHHLQQLICQTKL